jgi:precorrin-6x reductase
MIAIFGGTAEGRQLAEACESLGVLALYICAFEQGASQVRSLNCLFPLVGRLDAKQMEKALESARPTMAFDATHPYAANASENIKAACKALNLPLARIDRETIPYSGRSFPCLESAVSWLETEPGAIFATVGASGAKALSALPDFRERVWLRILPSMESLSHCMALGFRSSRLILMEGPFSESLNMAMFSHAKAQILLTKESGPAGGFQEKMEAAKKLNMAAAVVERPRQEPPGSKERVLSLEEALSMLERMA